MNNLINIDITLYFRILNSEMYGGKGTEGYSQIKYGEVKNLEIIDDAFVERQKGIQAEMLKVSTDDVMLISKEDYDIATNDEEDYDEDEDEDYNEDDDEDYDED